MSPSACLHEAAGRPRTPWGDFNVSHHPQPCSVSVFGTIAIVEFDFEPALGTWHFHVLSLWTPVAAPGPSPARLVPTSVRISGGGQATLPAARQAAAEAIAFALEDSEPRIVCPACHRQDYLPLGDGWRRCWPCGQRWGPIASPDPGDPPDLDYLYYADPAHRRIVGPGRRRWAT